MGFDLQRISIGKNWNVVTGCNKYSDGCLNCYAEDDTVEWLKGMRKKLYIQHGSNLTMHYNRLNWPLKNLAKNPKRPAKSFVTDMGDLFHAQVPNNFVFKVFEVMLKVPQHRFYVLTKRTERLGELGPKLPWRPWMCAGVTAESDKYVHRITHLKKLPVMFKHWEGRNANSKPALVEGKIWDEYPESLLVNVN